MAGKVLVKSFSTTQTIGWVCLVCLFVSASGMSLPRIFNRTNDRFWKDCHNDSPIVEFCQGKCMKVDVIEVVKRYPNLFLPKYENVAGERIFYKGGTKYFNSDLDTCCPTSRTFDNLPVRTNILGEERTIFQTEWLRQWIPVGSCIKNGNCNTCQVRNRTMSILVIDFDWKHHLPLEFDQFSIPLYCTCID